MPITVQDLLNVYYAPFWDLARLCGASAVERDLDPAKARKDPEAIGGREHTWHWCCTEPVQLMKLWSDLYQLRLKVPYGDRKQFAPPQLFDDCRSVYDMLETLTLLIEPGLAKLYMDYILFIDTNNTYYKGEILSKDKSTSESIKKLYMDGSYSQSVGAYIKARIDEARSQIEIFA
jgi:hypothetical protein